jgi:hypothetical protein
MLKSIPKTRVTLVQKSLFKWGQNDFLSRFLTPLIGGRLKNYFAFKSDEVPLKNLLLSRVIPLKICLLRWIALLKKAKKG